MTGKEYEGGRMQQTPYKQNNPMDKTEQTDLIRTHAFIDQKTTTE